MFYVRRVGIQYQTLNNFENDTMKLLANEAKLSGLRARNCATFQQVLSLKFVLGPEKLATFRETGPRPCSNVELFTYGN